MLCLFSEEVRFNIQHFWLGHYQFSLPSAVIAGKMRPLRDPNDTDEQDD